MGRKPCCEKVGLRRGRWTAEEDASLVKYIEENGEGSWRSLPKNAGLLRCGKSCRLRWANYLRPDLDKGRFSSEEEDLIIRLHSSFGSRWSMIARHLSGRTDNGIKNYWNSHLSRKIHPLWRRKICDDDRSFPMNVAKLDLPPKRKNRRTSRILLKEEKLHFHESTELPLQDCDVDGCPVNDAVPPLITEVITREDEVVSDPDDGNNDKNTENFDEAAMKEKEVEAEEGPDDSESNIRMNCSGDKVMEESELFDIDGLFDLSGERDEILNYSFGTKGLSFPEMAEEWDRYSSVEICREEEVKKLSWLWDDDDWGRTNCEGEFDSEKHDAMIAWLLS